MIEWILCEQDATAAVRDSRARARRPRAPPAPLHGVAGVGQRGYLHQRLEHRGMVGFYMKHPPSWEPTVGIYLGSYGGPSGGGLFLVSEVPL